MLEWLMHVTQSSFTKTSHAYKKVCVCVCERMCARVCACVCVITKLKIRSLENAHLQTLNCEKVINMWGNGECMCVCLCMCVL